MPGKKHMNQDRPANGQDTLQTMQDKKSGIYQDRVDGKLPQGRVAQHYQAMDAKMMQEKKTSTPPKPGTAGYNAYMAKKNADKKAASESGILGTIKKYAKKADKFLTGTSGATGSGF